MKETGFHHRDSGFDLGVDYRFLDHFAVGVMGNYTYTWTDLRPGTVAVNSGRGGLYASYLTGGYYLNAGVCGGYNTYDTNRYALFGHGVENTDGEEWSSFISTEYDFHFHRHVSEAEPDHGYLTIGPIASLQYKTGIAKQSQVSTFKLSIRSTRRRIPSSTSCKKYAASVIIAPVVTTWP
jgi:uncharacterized protein with beta-barrel porin domain